MVNSINADYNGYINFENNKNNVTSPIVEPDISIFQTEETDIENREQLTETEKTENEAKSSVSSKEELQEKFEQIQAEQGIVGKTIDKIKNKFPALSKIGFTGSDEIKEIMAKVESGEISIEEADEALEKYKENQEKTTDLVLNAGTLAIVTAVGLLAGPLGWGALATIGIATATGAVARVALGATEAATNEVKGDYTMEDVGNDAIKGGIIGFLKGAGKVIGMKFRLPHSQQDKAVEQIKNAGRLAAVAKTSVLFAS